MAYNFYFLAVAGAVILYLIRYIVRYIAARRFIKANGCKPVRQLPQFERIVGIGLLRTQVNASKNKNLLATSLKRYQNMGFTWSASLMGGTFYNTIDPENVKTVLSTNFQEFGLGERYNVFGQLLGRGIFTSDGAHWEHSRSLVRPNFTRAQVADLNTFETHIQHLISKIPRDGSTIDLQTLFFQLTLDSATEFLFGESVASLTSSEGSEQQQFGKAFDIAQLLISKRGRFGKFFRFYSNAEIQRVCKIVHEFVDKIVYKALEKTDPEDVEKSIGEDDDRYVFLKEMVKATRDPIRLRDELLNILLAGRDTTASLLSHTFHVLAKRPDVFAKLRLEVEDLNGKKPNYDTIKSMRYLKNVLSESLRLYPVVPSNARFANKDTKLPRGGGPDGQSPVYIPKGSAVAYNVFCMHRRKDIYGPDADEFRPERWDPERGLRPGWGYLPFNGGPRICVGQQFALTEASYTIIRLLQEFKNIENRGVGEWVENLHLTLSIDDGVKVAMIPR
ncbi:putative cytochrome P450 alkane hydroxylase [Bisporella sp. PMI_857]|nr:putative cytochrome P450 alkane hydroxylase [Bisporella sp. PMI_857]